MMKYACPLLLCLLPLIGCHDSGNAKKIADIRSQELPKLNEMPGEHEALAHLPASGEIAVLYNVTSYELNARARMHRLPDEYLIRHMLAFGRAEAVQKLLNSKTPSFSPSRLNDKALARLNEALSQAGVPKAGLAEISECRHTRLGIPDPQDSQTPSLWYDISLFILKKGGCYLLIDKMPWRELEAKKWTAEETEAFGHSSRNYWYCKGKKR